MKYLAIIIGVFCISLIWLLSVLGFFKFSNFVLYDKFVTHMRASSQTTSDILIIEANEETGQRGDDIWLALLNNLHKLRPKLIVFTFIPRHVSKTFYQRAHDLKNVIFGRKVIYTPVQKTRATLESLPYEYDENYLNIGLIQIPPAYYGIHRIQYLTVPFNEENYLTMEHLSLKSGYHRQPDTVLDKYLINFIGKSGMPNIRVERAISGELIPELVKDKTILIGFQKTTLHGELLTPMAPNKGISKLKFHGYALDTLISGDIIHEMSSVIKLVFITSIVLFSLIMYQFLNIHFFSWVTLPLLCLYLFITWLVLSHLSIWLPLSEMMVAHISTLYFVYSNRTKKQDKATQKMLLYTSMKWRERYLPESFYDTEEHWTQVINMVKQTFGLSRTIFLDRVKGDHRVKEVIALNCSLSDINERRRDYERTPYSTALEEGGPIKMGKFNFLTKASQDEAQYLVPLLFGGQILGFWAFGIDPSRALAIENFNTVIMNFANQIGELLYRREQKRLKDISAERHYLKYLHLEGRDVAYQELNRSIILIEQRLKLLETVFHGMGLSTILYDLFGRVIHVNKNMTELLKNSDLLPYEITAMDFISKLCKLPADEIRSLLRKTIFEQDSITLTAFIPMHKEKAFVLNVRPLLHQQTDEILDDAYPFQIYGILLEVVEITEIKNINRFKEDLLGKVGLQVRGDFESIIIASSLLKRSDLSEEKKQRVDLILNRRITEISEYFKDAQMKLGKDFHIGMSEDFSIDPIHPIDSAISELKPLADNRNISFKINIPHSRSLLCSNPDTLSEIIKYLLEFLINDAVEKSKIFIDMIEDYDQWQILNLTNQGFGMPNEDFQTFLNDKSDKVSAEFRKMQSASRKVKEWGGNLTASSTVGSGTKFILYFKTEGRPFRDVSSEYLKTDSHH